MPRARPRHGCAAAAADDDDVDDDDDDDDDDEHTAVAKQTMPVQVGKRHTLADKRHTHLLTRTCGCGRRCRSGLQTIPVASETITVADPRPLTADLVLEAPTWVSHGGERGAERGRG